MLEKRVVLGELEVRVLNALWTRGPCTVQDVVDHLQADDDGQARHYNTCSTVLNRLAKRDIVRRDTTERTIRYEALLTREELGRRYLSRVRDDIFGGSLQGLVTALLGPGRVRKRDAARIRKLVAEIEDAAAEQEATDDGA